MKRLLIAFSVLLTAAPALSQTEVTLGRFFGACEDAGTDTKASVGEACIIQSIINAADASNDDLTVNTLPTDWGNFYDQIKASYAGGNAPNIHTMHKSRLAEFASLGALAPIGDDLEAVGIDPSDWSENARENVTYDGQIYGLPMDIHANLWHVNMDVMTEAGLVNEDGAPILPSSPEELLEHAKMVQESTGKDYLAADFAQFPIGVRLVLALLWQQEANIFDGDTATLDTPEARAAIKAITQLFEAGYANPNQNYADSQQSFLNGEAAVLVNGTWVVDFYTEQAADEEVQLSNYQVADFPTLFDKGATWADSHMWVISRPTQADDEQYQAALKVLAFINDHNIDWARTGHMAVRQSVIESQAYQDLPHRDEYVGTADIASSVPATVNYGAIQDTLNRELQAIWLTGKSIDDALESAQQAVQDQLDR